MLKIDTVLANPSLQGTIEAAQRAEQLGFDGLMTAETSHDPFLPLVIAAEHTENLEIGTAIAVAFPRSPMLTATTSWDLQAMSKGRFLLGLGTQVKGHNERRFSVPWGKPGPRLKEVIESMHAIWECWQNNAPLAYEGEFYRFSLMTPFFNPGPQPFGRPPIFISGMNPYILRLTGELCDGLHVHPLHTEKFLREVIQPAIADGAARSGRDVADVALAAPAFVVVGENDEERASAAVPVKQQIAFYASTPAYRTVLETHGWEDLSPKLTAMSKAGDWMGMAEMIDDDMLSEFAVIGKADEIPQLLKKKYEGLVARVSLYLPFIPGDRDDWWSEIVTTLHR